MDLQQEIHEGPGRRVDYDGALWTEEIVIQYQTEPVNGIPLNTISIEYIGPDQELLNKKASGLAL